MSTAQTAHSSVVNHALDLPARLAKSSESFSFAKLVEGSILKVHQIERH